MLGDEKGGGDKRVFCDQSFENVCEGSDDVWMSVGEAELVGVGLE